MEEAASAAGGADLLMECEEEEQEVCPQSPKRDDEEEERHVEAVQQDQEEQEEQTDLPPVRVIPIPIQLVGSCSPKPSVKHSGASLGFKVNGRPVALQPEGGGTELQLRSHPAGSASGFTTVQVPITAMVHRPAGTLHINPSSSTTVPPAPEADTTPIITGVVSGEAAQRVLSNHSIQSSPPVTGPTPLRTSTLTAPQITTPPAPHRTKLPPTSNPAAPHTLLHKGQLGPVAPPDCAVCLSQYRLITELRGFMCLCSPAITQSLRNLKKKTSYRRRSRDKNKTSKPSRDPQTCSSKASKTRPGLNAPRVVSPLLRTHRQSDDFLSDQFTSPAPPATISSPQWDQSDPLPDSQTGKLVIMVEDFYYGSAPGRSAIKPSVGGTGPYRCIHCPKTLCNNISLMSHMQEHVSSERDELMDPLSSCPYCYRHFLSSFKLQCHLEAVHNQYESTAKCRICELVFGSEPAFLWHMKSTHKPGEMPYTCQVCDFRSSFYSDVWCHFEQVHAGTKHLLCHYCLRVLRSNSCYQQHVARHQKKHVFSCDRCRLHFLYLKERIEHKLLHHRTHIRPPQLSGLKPGTKVTVRTYSVVGGHENEEKLQKVSPFKVVDVDPPPPIQETPRRRPVERLGLLLSHLDQDSEAVGVSQPSHLCVECLTSFQDFSSHFPSLVHCSLCAFVTCCSTSYANHMINNHATCRKKSQYHSIYQSDPRLSQTLRCVSCAFSTCRGDVMANHLTERREHSCIMSTHDESGVNGAEVRKTQTASSQGGGAFIPIHLLPSCQTSSQLSVKALTSPSPLSSPPAMTIKFLGPRLQPEQCSVSPLSASQLSAVLSALSHGVLPASRWYKTSPLTLRSWIQQQQFQLLNRKWCWRTERVAEWVLSQREQQLRLSEDVLLQAARSALGEDSELQDRYSWTVELMLRHQLSLAPPDTDGDQHYRGRLPQNVRDNSRAFMRSVCSQIHSQQVPPQCVASMDEFSIFLDLDQFSNQNPLALQLFGSSEDKPVCDVILAATSDGTFLPPLLFFRGTSSHVPEGFPENVLLEARQAGFTDLERLHVWIDQVWRPHVASQHNRESVLMVDVHRGHLTDEFRDSMTSVSTDVIFIPAGSCCRVQPLDVCVTPVLRDFLQVRWTQLVSQGGLEGLGLDQLALTLTCWFSEVSSTLNSETHFLRRSFALVWNLQAMEDRGEAATLIQALTEALVRPVETSEPPTEPELGLLLLMQEEQEEGESALCLVLNGDGDQETSDG